MRSELDYIRQETAGLAAHDAEQRVTAANTVGAGFVGIV